MNMCNSKSILNTQAFVLRAQNFLDQLFIEINKAGIKIHPHWQIDHLCFRVGSEESYQQYKNDFLKFSDLLIESPVNGRLISTFKLHTPVVYKNWAIDLVELPAPKKGKTTIEGFEHIEIVIDIPFGEIEALYPNLAYDKSGLQKKLNQELEVSFGAIALKFHHMSLDSVIRLESNAPVFSALNESKILDKFSENLPLIAGTFPLGLETSESDLDILLQAQDLDALERKLIDFGDHLKKQDHSNFKITRETVNSLPSLICNFIFSGVAFEIFAQNKTAVEQVAYRHFLIEERLLKLGGLPFLDLVLTYRRQGLKTEPAFIKALIGKSENAYDLLLKIQKLPEEELKNLIN